MSRLNKKAVTIPKDVKVGFNQGRLLVQGSKGELSCIFAPSINIEIKDGQIRIKGDFGRKTTRTQAGLAFALINNMIKGVTQGYVKELEIVGAKNKAHNEKKKCRKYKKAT